MQTSLGIVGVIICVAVTAAPAQGQNVAACVQMQSSLQRLDCYDKLFRGNLSAQVGSKVDLKAVAPPKAVLPSPVSPPKAQPTVSAPKAQPTVSAPKAQPPVSIANQDVLKSDLVTNSTNKSAKFQERAQPKPKKQLKPVWVLRDDNSTKLVFSNSQQVHRNIVGQRARLSIEISCKDNTTALRLKFGGNIVASALDTARVRFSVDERPAEDYLFSISNDFKSVGLWSGEEAIPVIKTLLNGRTLTVEGAPYFARPVKAGFAIQGLNSAIRPLRGSCNW